MEILMSKVLKCTHCKETFATDDYGEDWSTPTKLYYGDYGEKRKWCHRIDLCPACSNEFFEWLWEHNKKHDIESSRSISSEDSNAEDS